MYFLDRTNKRGQTFPFDPELLVFSPMEARRTGRNGGVRIQIRNPKTKCLEPLVLQTPMMPTVFGLTTMDKSADNTNSNGWRIDFSFKEMLELNTNRETASNEVLELESFFISMYMLDQVVLRTAKENVRTWFAGSRQLERNPDVIDGLYNAITGTHYSKLSQRYYPPSIRVKANKSKGEFDFRVYDMSRQEMSPFDIKPYSRIMGLIEVTGIWFINEKFGVGMKLRQAQVRPTDTLDFFSFADTTDDIPPPAYEHEQQEPMEQDTSIEEEDDCEPQPKRQKLTGMK
jgi:hypothetical protein